MAHRSQQWGFNIVELMMTLAVAAILMGMALPSFSQMVYRNQMVSSANDMVSALQLARTQSVTRGRNAGICGSSDGTSCDEKWTQGYAIWVDVDRNGAASSDEIIKFFDTSPSLALTASNVIFDARGRPTSTVDDFVLTHNKCKKNRKLVNRIKIANTGRVAQSSEACS